MTPEQKTAVLEKLKAGKAKHAAARADAKAKGLPDPKPRKVRAKKPEALNPSSAPPENDTIRGIDATQETNKVAEKPVDPEKEATRPIDVPMLPDMRSNKKRSKIVKNAEAKPVPHHGKGLTTQGVPLKIDNGRDVINENTGNSVIPAQYAGQLDSIKKQLRQNKSITTTASPSAPLNVNGIERGATVKAVKSHIPDVATVESKGKPFSFSAMKKILYQ